MGSKPSAPPKVSVIMPSLNVAPYIRQCMESVINQSLKEIEILCIDAGSNDGTLDILREYEARDSRIHVILSDRRSYGYQVNLGFETAIGEYIGIVETDDYIDPDMYRDLYSLASSTMLPDVVKAGFYEVSEPNDQIEEILKIKVATGDVFPLTAHYELLSGHPSVWSCIYKKSFLERKQIRMQEEPGAAWVDNLFLFRTLCEAERICWLNRAVYYYREFSSGSSSRIRDCSIPIARINDIKDYLDQYGPDNLYLEKQLYQRALHYAYLILRSPSMTNDHLSQLCKMLSRFHRQAIVEQPFNWFSDKIIEFHNYYQKRGFQYALARFKKKFTPHN